MTRKRRPTLCGNPHPTQNHLKTGFGAVPNGGVGANLAG